MERATWPAPFELALQRFRRAENPFTVYRDPRVQRRLEPVDLRQAGLRQRHWGEAAFRDIASGFRYGEGIGFRHARLLIPGPGRLSHDA